MAANQARLEQLLLGYAVTDTGETFYQRLVTGDARPYLSLKPQRHDVALHLHRHLRLR